MRITEKEKLSIIHEAQNQFGIGTKVILFGSRVNDLARGGDIDLLVISSEVDEAELYRKKIKFLVSIKNKIEDQKIDVIIKQTNDTRGIIETALKEGIALC
jgi:predicted nucleotidyltransferase